MVDTFDSDFEIESSEEEREQEELGRQEDRQIALEERQVCKLTYAFSSWKEVLIGS